ncbi:SgcJ/EcaC family oxidoreductase [Actinoplanes sp. N902-109]|uniref:SgcJ/EcaC family oxidoreductase n=1 Tax=Actinoplanes sp. (strain N902-109) TaxID=649831 RepID=UPI0003294F47|nr:SgcJ/EcaC family oxidoreductase [Actinoplanes sp. N902-109]AGL14647.1 hypothetical protein L083_1137 [Actinoplanes sp. N902-109]
MTIPEIYDRLLTAWNDGDAARAAALFAPDGLMVDFDGSQAVGADIAARPGIPDGARHVAKIRAVRGNVLHAITGVVPAGGFDVDPALNAVQTVVVQDGLIVLFQSTPARYKGRPDLAASHNAELMPALLTGEIFA